METILITGSEGFVGKHLTRALNKEGYRVICTDIKAGSEILPLKFYNIDITKPELEIIFKENKIDYVFHLAAQISVQNSIAEPVFDAEHNIFGTLNLLKMCKKYNIKKIIGASTAAVYGEAQELPLTENSVLNPLSPYAVSKIAMENYIKLSGVDYIIFRYANIYGEGQNSKNNCGAVSIFLEKMLKNKEITIYGDGTQIRDFIYIDDVIELNIKAIKSELKNATLNFSSNTATTINELFEEIAVLTGYNKKPVYKSKRNGDITKNVLSNQLISSFYLPKTSLKNGLSKMLLSLK